MGRDEYSYFDNFILLEDYSIQATKSLQSTLENFDPNTIKEKMKQVHVIEHTADIEKHKLMKRLMKEFLPPIEREDIIELTNSIDDLTDAIEDVVIRLYMYHVQTIPPEAKKFVSVILECVEALRNTLIEFKNYKKSKTLEDWILEVNRLEEIGDQVYTNAMHDLFLNEKDPKVMLAWMETYERLEKCCDRCEDVSSIVSSAALKNS